MKRLIDLTDEEIFKLFEDKTFVPLHEASKPAPKGTGVWKSMRSIRLPETNSVICVGTVEIDGQLRVTHDIFRIHEDGLKTHLSFNLSPRAAKALGTLYATSGLLKISDLT